VQQSKQVHQVHQVHQSSQKGGFSADDLQSFCPKAFAGLEPLPPTLARRSIPIVLQRRKPQEVVKSALHLLLPQNTQKFTSWMQTWAQDPNRLNQISKNFEDYDHETQPLPGFSPHQQDSSRVLIALADTLGGHWPEKARTALQEIFREQYEREATPIHLLSDIRDAFAHHQNPDRLFTAELLDYLLSLDHRPWHEWNKNGGPMTAKFLSRLLGKTFQIYSRSIRRGDGHRRGFLQSDFIEAWERYLPDPNPLPNQQNRGLSQCPSSNTQSTEENAIAATAGNVAAESIAQHRASSQDKSPQKLPNYQLTQPVSAGRGLPNSSIKLRSVSMSQFKSDCQKAWTKSASLMKQLTAKASGMFTSTRS
jgi:hypothetical protein